jgi:hypothetical protein
MKSEASMAGLFCSKAANAAAQALAQVRGNAQGLLDHGL